MKLSKTWVAAAAIAALCGTAQAALVNQGNATVLDTNTNLIWLQDWNLNGSASRSTQNAWAAGLTFAGSSDWQLPTRIEFGALFTAYGNLRYAGPFTNVLNNYWAEEDASSPGMAMYFTPTDGANGSGIQSYQVGGTAVRLNVTAAIPEPQTYAMMALGLAAIGGFVARRRKQDQAA